MGHPPDLGYGSQNVLYLLFGVPSPGALLPPAVTSLRRCSGPWLPVVLDLSGPCLRRDLGGFLAPGQL